MAGKIRNLLRDLLLAFVVGVGIGLAAGLILFLIGFFVYGPSAGWAALRVGLILIGSVILIFSAILFMKGGNLPESAFHFVVPRKRKPEEAAQPLPQLPIFRTAGRRFTMLFIGIGVIFAALVLDYAIYMFRL